MDVLKRLYPTEYVSSIYHINVSRLWDEGKRAIITDLDNTLVRWNAPSATPKLVSWLKMVQDTGFRVCILSNNDRLRVTEFAKPLGLIALDMARKPRLSGFRHALNLLQVSVAETVMIGDQVFTDILGGNRMGMYTVLVAPIHEQEYIGTRVMRRMERIVLRRVPLSQHMEYFSYDGEQPSIDLPKGRNDL